MCEFYSFVSDGKGKYYYFDEKVADKVRKKQPDWRINSHDSVIEWFKLDGDKLNKYEYNPFFRVFDVDQINTTDDRNQAEEWVRKFFSKKDVYKFYQHFKNKVDYKKLNNDLGNIPTKKDVIKLIRRIDKIKWFKPQKRPLKAKLQVKVNSILKMFKLEGSLELNKLDSPQSWVSARDSARDSAWASAWASAWDSARVSAWASARVSAWASARASAWDSARVSARASEFEVVKDLMQKKGYKKNPFIGLLDLWEMGLYPCGLIKGKFVIYYVPLRNNKKR